MNNSGRWNGNTVETIRWREKIEETGEGQGGMKRGDGDGGREERE